MCTINDCKLISVSATSLKICLTMFGEQLDVKLDFFKEIPVERISQTTCLRG